MTTKKKVKEALEHTSTADSERKKMFEMLQATNNTDIIKEKEAAEKELDDRLDEDVNKYRNAFRDTLSEVLGNGQ